MTTFSRKCDNFTALLHRAAAERGCFFDEESGEGHSEETDTLFCEDVSGWLIPLGRKAEYIASDRGDRKWQEFFVFAEWRHKGDSVAIDFKKYSPVLA